MPKATTIETRKCIHNLLFTEPCNECHPPSGVMPTNISECRRCDGHGMDIGGLLTGLDCKACGGTGEIIMSPEDHAATVAAIRTILPPKCANTKCSALLLMAVPNDGHTLVYCASCRAILDAQEDES